MARKTLVANTTYRLRTGVEVESFELVLEPYPSLGELHRLFHDGRRSSTGWAEQMIGFMPIINREMRLRLAIVRGQDLHRYGCFSFSQIAQEFSNANLWRCPAQVGPDFWKADRPKLQPGELLRIAMEPVTTDEGSGIRGIFEVTQKDHALGMTLDAHSAPHQVSFDDMSRFVVQIPPHA